MPNSLNIQADTKETTNIGKFEIKNVPSSTAIVISNSIRRVLLSSMPGCAFASLVSPQLAHEFCAIHGAKEDGTQLVLNIKALNIRYDDLFEGTKEAYIDVFGPKIVTASDIQMPDGLEIINKEQVLLHLEENEEFNAILHIECGRGNRIADPFLKAESTSLGNILIDALFNPVRDVNVECTLAKNNPDLTDVCITIKTNGTISPGILLNTAIKILNTHAKVFADNNFSYSASAKPQEASPAVFKDMELEEMGLSSRTLNALYRFGARKLSDVIMLSREQMLQIPHFGEKCFLDIEEKVKNMGFDFRHE